MTEREAWLTMAEAYETPRGERTKEQRNLTRFGICWGMSELLGFGKTLNLQRELIAEARNMNGLSSYYICDYKNPANDKLRADFCRFQYYRLGGE